MSQLQLVQTPQVQEEWYDLRQDGKLKYFLGTWYVTKGDERVQPKAVVVFVHGFAEYIRIYDEAFRYFAQHGYQVNAFDQRGYGYTWYELPDRDNHHGWTSWKDQFTDVSHMINLTRSRLDAAWGKDKVPIFLMGHSMGGGISSGFFTRDSGEGPPEEVKNKVSGVMLSAPWLDIFSPVPHVIGDPLFGAILSVYPRMPNIIGLKHADLSRDPAVVENARKDPKHSFWVFARGLHDPFVNGPKIVSRDYVKWPERLPLLIQHGTTDRITRFTSSDTLCRRLRKMGRDAECVPLEGYYHELLQEPGDDKIKVANTYISWLDRHLPPASGSV